MRTKQLRLNDFNQIRQRMPEFLGKKINIVLTDNTAMFGELTNVSENEIVLKNMRQVKVKFLFRSIVEVYLDTQVK